MNRIKDVKSNNRDKRGEEIVGFIFVGWGQISFLFNWKGAWMICIETGWIDLL